MHLFIYVMLLAACCSSKYVYAASIFGNSAAGALPTGNSDIREVDTATVALNLPRGFKPQPPPVNPLLYPFATATPAAAAAASTAGWKPMLGSSLPTEYNSFIPLLQDRSSVAGETQPVEEGPVLESIVYGIWKPDPPLKPDKIFRQKQGDTINLPRNRAPNEPAVENLGYSHPITDRSDTIDYIHQIIAPKYGHQTNSPNEHTLPIISVNVSDPKLRDIVKQINDSAETVNFYIRKANPESSNLTWPTATTRSSEEQQHLESNKIWPTDFLSSTEQITTSKSNYNNLEDSAVPLHNLENISENILPQLPFNITKVGVPYEQQNSAEGPTICVPLTVREQTNASENADMERVYCFPLPTMEIAAANLNTTEAVLHNDDGKETTNASNTSLKNSHLFLIVSMLAMLKFEWL